MTSVAEQLRRARETQGLSLHDLAELTKIRADHLDALEKANYQPFPAPVYIRGSVRTCASILKLDVPVVLANLEVELAHSPEFSTPPSLVGEHRGPLDWVTYQLSRVNWRVAGVVGAVFVIFAVALWGWQISRQRLRQDPLRNLGPGMYRPASIPEGDMLPLPTNAPVQR